MTRELADQGARECASVVARTARHFSWGFRLLPERRRRAIETLYAFARHVDDLADEPGPSREERAEALEQVRVWLDAEVFGHAAPSSALAAALRETVRNWRLPLEPFHDLIEGMLWDARGRAYPTVEDTEAYCFRAASTVGLLSIPIFGASDREAAHAPAIRLGLFMQWVNILRDVGEDLELGRIYVPSDALARHGLDEDGLRRMAAGPFPSNGHPWPKVGAELARRARAHLAASRDLLPLLDPRGALCVRVLAGLYEDILTLLEERRFDVFTERPRLSRTRKLARVAAICLDPRHP